MDALVHTGLGRRAEQRFPCCGHCAHGRGYTHEAACSVEGCQPQGDQPAMHECPGPVQGI